VKFKGVIVEFRDDQSPWSNLCMCKANVAFQCNPNDSFFVIEAMQKGTHVELSIGDERVELGKFDCDGKYSVDGREVYSSIRSFDKPGKWRIVAERAGK
jgi:hypothetical protein